MDEIPEATTVADTVDFGELHAILVRAVRRICPSWMASQHDDLAQSAVLRIVKKCAEAKESPPIMTSYLWKVAHSVVMDEIRRRRRHPEVELETMVQTEPVSPWPTPESGQARTELSEAISTGLTTLNEARRCAVLLHLYGFSLKDSARMLGWNAKRVDNQRYQGLGELRAYLEERGFEP